MSNRNNDNDTQNSIEIYSSIQKHIPSKNKRHKKDKLRRSVIEEIATKQLGFSLIDKLSHKLKRHTEINESIDHINGSLYYLLCHPFTFVNAYVRISKNKGALTKGVAEDQEINKFFGQSDAIKIANKFKNRTYEFLPVRRVMIEKLGKKKKRPIDTPTQEDRIVQEAIRGILEAIYEPEFRDFEKYNSNRCTNYGFRPGQSCWGAIEQIKTLGRGATHVIEGDIVGAYNNINHDILLSILSRRIKDKLFLQLMNKMLKSGIMHKDKYIHSMLGTPQGGIVSPLLFNIYMFEFDKFIYENFISLKNKPITKPKNNPEFKRNQYRMRLALEEYRKCRFEDLEKAKSYLKEFRRIRNLNFKVPSRIPETLLKITTYARYADDWVLLLTGTESVMIEAKITITDYLKNNLQLELDPVKTLISRLDEGFKFLGFFVKTWDTTQNKITYITKNEKGKIIRFPRRTTSRQIAVYPDKDRIFTNLLRNKFCKTNDYIPIARSGWTALDEYEIVLKFRQTFVGLANYYRFVENKRVLNRVSYIMQYSCAKTIAYRQKTSISNVFAKYGKNMTIHRDRVNSKGNEQVSIHFKTLHELVTKDFVGSNYVLNSEYDPFKITSYWRTKFKIFFCCCICNSEDRVALHHINSIRALKSKNKKKQRHDQYSYIRSCLNRLQIPVCHKCHLDITNGVYSKKSPVEFYDEFIAKL